MSRMEMFFNRLGENMTYKNRTQTSPGNPAHGEEPTYSENPETVKVIRGAVAGPTQTQSPKSYQDEETLVVHSMRDMEENAHVTFQGERYVLRNKDTVQKFGETVYKYDLIREVAT